MFMIGLRYIFAHLSNIHMYTYTTTTTNRSCKYNKKNNNSLMSNN